MIGKHSQHIVQSVFILSCMGDSSREPPRPESTTMEVQEYPSPDPRKSSHKNFIPTRNSDANAILLIRDSYHTFRELPWATARMLRLDGKVSGHDWELGGEEGEKAIT